MSDKKKRYNLRSLSLDEISLVDRSANQLADVVLFKRFTKAAGPTPNDVHVDRPMGTCKLGKADCPGMNGGTCPDEQCGVGKADVEKAPAGVQFVIGFPKDGGGSEVQSVIFNQDDWTEEDARSWLKDHSMSSGKVDTTANTYRFRQKDPENYSRFRVITPGAQMAKTLRLGESFAAAQEAIGAAIQKKYSPQAPWVRDVYEDSAIIDSEGQTWRVGYTIDRESIGKLKVSLAEPVVVQVGYEEVGKKQPEQIPAELLFRVGKLKAGLVQVNRRIDKFK